MSVRTTILLDADLLDRLDRHARRRRVTKTSVITAALESWLEAHDEAPALAFIGVGRSAHGRLSLDGRSIARREAGRRPEPARAQGVVGTRGAAAGRTAPTARETAALRSGHAQAAGDVPAARTRGSG
jgi:predicted transcriptional regulator